MPQVPPRLPRPMEASCGLARSLSKRFCGGPTSWSLDWAGCGLNGTDYQITAGLMAEITCKYARRPG